MNDINWKTPLTNWSLTASLGSWTENKHFFFRGTNWNSTNPEDKYRMEQWQLWADDAACLDARNATGFYARWFLRSRTTMWQHLTGARGCHGNVRFRFRQTVSFDRFCVKLTVEIELDCGERKRLLNVASTTIGINRRITTKRTTLAAATIWLTDHERK